MINYYLPGIYNNQPLYSKILSLKEEYPWCFYDDVNIEYIFGCFPGCIWNGGVHSNQDVLVTSKDMTNLFKWYFNKGIKVQLTFTNPALEETDVYDRYGNTILKIASNFTNIEILVSSPILEEYIRKNYPNFRIDQSIIATTRKRAEYNLDDTKEDILKYNRIVLPRKYIKDFDFLNSVPEEYRSRIEILANEPCPTECPRLFSHYYNIGESSLFMEPSGKTGCSNAQKLKTPMVFYNTREYNYNNYEELSEIKKLGYTEIKIGGRLTPLHTILYMGQYLIKPEYKLDVQRILLIPFKYVKYPSLILEEN